jgi:hypothetical protein
MNPNKKTARLAGIIYLTMVITGLFAQFVRLELMVADDPAATADNITASETLFRLGFMSDLIMMSVFLLLPLGLLVFCSGYFPKVLGILLVLGCFGLLLQTLIIFLAPDYEELALPGLAISALAEVSFALWLLLKGVRSTREQPIVTPRLSPAH